MDEQSSSQSKSRKPVPMSKLTGCPLNYYQCEMCVNDSVAGCCPKGSSCMCRDGHLDMCETF
ncbi:MAG: hypothetical protein HY914_05705 [Desulfomonile tiedjei]|nr:hypothetical protein [Desulfomonile tiedjei]